jgi:hypothetical protein
MGEEAGKVCEDGTGMKHISAIFHAILNSKIM